MKTLILIISVILILLYLIQDGKTEGFLNSNQVYKNVKERGAEKTVFAITGAFGIIFIILSLVEGIK